MKLETIDLVFSQEYLRATLMVSLLTVWVLVGLFFYLNRYTRRYYFTIWTAAWLFYALWLTLCLTAPNPPLGSTLFMLKQCCISVSAVFLVWGSLSFLSLPVRQSLVALFMFFLLAWSFVSPSVLTSVPAVELPVFSLLGSGSLFVANCFYRLRKKVPYVGAGMLSLGFTLWGIYLATYPMSLLDANLRSAGFFAAAVVQLFIAVSMIVLVLEEVRHTTEDLRREMERVRSEKEALQVKVLGAEEQCRSLYDQVRLTDGLQKAYDELRRTQAQVVQQERLCALGQMASGVAHDVNNALSPIAAYTDLLLLTFPQLPPAVHRHIQTIKRCGDDIAHIVARMREFYRPQSESGHLIAVDANELVEHAIELTRPRWRDLPQRQGLQIVIERDLATNLPPLVCDPTDLREALTNLVFNAIEALPYGGTITLATRPVRQPDPSQQGAFPGIEIQVRDDGMGMDEATRQHCMEPFFSTKTHRGGAGLGLAMVYGMIRRHGGSVQIESAPAQGTCVRLVFPFREEALAAVKPAPPLPKESCSFYILCVDDEPDLRELLRECLAVFNHRVILAANGADGLRLFQQALVEREPFQAVITDLGMPTMDGKQLARSIKAQAPQTPVIMMTGWGTMMEADNTTVEGVDALVSKPVRLQELNDLLLQLCH